MSPASRYRAPRSIAGWSATASPFGPGGVRRGRLRGGPVGWCTCAVLQRRSGKPCAHRQVSARTAQSGCAGLPRGRQAGFDRSRSDRIGCPSSRADGRPGHGRPWIVPGEPEFVGCRHSPLVTSRPARAAPGRGTHGRPRPGSRPIRPLPSSRVSTTGAACAPASIGRTSTSATNARPVPRPSGRAGADGSAGRAARRPPRSRDWPGRSVGRGTGGRAGVGVDRPTCRRRHQSSRNAPRSSASRATAP